MREGVLDRERTQVPREAEMITMTFTWWGFVLYFLGLGVLYSLAGRLGEKLGHATYRRWKLWHDRKLMEWSRRG